ncbi:MAG: EAL domain-containing protein [Bacilli bacterium]|nr:EAL domain-containing protein [Bacilli bacterium]
MQFNLSFDYAALAIMAMLAISMVFRSQFRGVSNKIFMGGLIVTVLATVFDILASMPMFSSDALTALNTVFLILRPTIILFLFLYAITLVKTYYVLVKKKYLLAVAMAPYLLLFVLLIVNLFNGCIFTYTPGPDGAVYARGPLMWVFYVVAFLYGFAALGAVIISRQFHSVRQFVPVLGATVFQIGSSLFQLFVGSILVEMFMSSLTWLTLSAFVENAEYMFDYKTRRPTLNAFVNDVEFRFSVHGSFAVMFVHVDNTAVLYNLYPHEKAYGLLRFMSNEMIARARAFDHGAALYYIGESTFAFVFKEKGKGNDILASLHEYFSDHISLGEVTFRFLISTCIVECPEDCDNLDALLSFSTSYHHLTPESGNVDLKPYRKEGGNVLVELDRIIERAIREKSFSLYYQPIYSIKQKKFLTAEALLRLDDPSFGLVMPGLMVPYSERWGKIGMIGDIVLEKSFAFYAERMKDVLAYVEINLSPLQLLDPNLIPKIDGLAKRYGLSPECIVFEITETVAVQDNPDIIASINGLANAGYRIAIDDFGTGYSNIASFDGMKISIVKFDMSLAKILAKGEYDEFFVSLFKMFQDRNIEVLIEGVEDENLAKKVIGLGCDYIQGYYYCKPIPEADFAAFITEKNK